MTLPPRPWSERMKNAAEVRSAYLKAESNISEKLIDAETAEAQQTLFAQLKAAQHQSDAAHMQMWIIHNEETTRGR